MTTTQMDFLSCLLLFPAYLMYRHPMHILRRFHYYLRKRRVGVYRLCNVLYCRSGLHGKSDFSDEVGRVRANDGTAQHLVGSRVRDYLHEAFGLAHAHRLAARGVREPADGDIDAFFLGLFFTKAHARYLGVGENACRYHRIVHLRFLAKGIVSGHYALDRSNMREQHLARDISYGVDALYARLHVIVNGNPALFDCDSELVEPKTYRIERASYGDHDLFGYELAPVLQGGLDPSFFSGDGLDLDFGQHLHSGFLVPFRDDPGDHLVFGGKYGRKQLDYHDLAAERGEHLGELAAHDSPP